MISYEDLRIINGFIYYNDYKYKIRNERILNIIKQFKQYSLKYLDDNKDFIDDLKKRNKLDILNLDFLDKTEYRYIDDDTTYNSKTYLSIPFKKKDEFKKLYKIRWDADLKLWYINKMVEGLKPYIRI